MFNASFEYAKDEIDRRLKNPFWGSFVLAWLGWNWKVWYLTIFVDDKLVGNKLQYIETIHSHMKFMSPIMGQFMWPLLNYLIAPGLIAFLVIWHLPKITNKFLEKQQKNKEREDEILLKNLNTENQILEQKAIVAEQKLETLEKELSLKMTEEEGRKKEFEQRIQKLSSAEKALEDERLRIRKENKKISGGNKIDKIEIISEEPNQIILWDKEYDLLLSKHSNIITVLQNFYYDKRGSVGVHHENISVSQERILDSNGLMSKNQENNRYELTEKGRYFLIKSS